MKFAQAERKTLTETAQDDLRHAIIVNKFYPKSQLPAEAELCEILVVSRTVVREVAVGDDGQVIRRHRKDKPLMYSYEYHLPNAFDFMVWRRGTTRPRCAAGDGSA